MKSFVILIWAPVYQDLFSMENLATYKWDQVSLTTNQYLSERIITSRKGKPSSLSNPEIPQGGTCSQPIPVLDVLDVTLQRVNLLCIE